MLYICEIDGRSAAFTLVNGEKGLVPGKKICRLNSCLFFHHTTQHVFYQYSCSRIKHDDPVMPQNLMIAAKCNKNCCKL